MNDFREVIGCRRDGRIHSRDDLIWLAKGAADGSIPEEQLSAWLMAAYLNPLTVAETVELTTAMAESGERLDLSDLPGPHLDKHSTGGVGDKTTIVLLPLLADLGVSIVKMSGNGLGITGGTLDKLLSIPGFRVDLSPSELVDQASSIGLALGGQTSQLAPADKELYSLRDRTATTESIPLIVSSILSKKIAGGAEWITIDVKCGSGAFMTNLESARSLAEMLELVGNACGIRVRTAVTDMNQPLGSAIGNALEVEEGLRILANETLSTPSARFQHLCVDLAAEALVFCGRFSTSTEAEQRINRSLQSGSALAKALQWFSAQGGPPSKGEILDRLPRAPVRHEALAHGCGWIAGIDARVVGESVIQLGGGRLEKDGAIDRSVGITLDFCVGSQVEPGRRLFTVHAKDQVSASLVAAKVLDAIEISPSPVEPSKLQL